MDYIIGDTLRMKIRIRDYDDAAATPSAVPTLGIYQLDGTALLTSGVSTLTAGSTGEYYYDWTVSTGLTANQNLITVWSWPSHKKVKTIPIITQLS